MHHFVVKFSKFPSPQAARGHWPSLPKSCGRSWLPARPIIRPEQCECQRKKRSAPTVANQCIGVSVLPTFKTDEIIVIIENAYRKFGGLCVRLLRCRSVQCAAIKIQDTHLSVTTSANLHRRKKNSSTDSKENFLCICDEDFHLTCTMLLHYLVKLKNSKTPQLWNLIYFTWNFNKMGLTNDEPIEMPCGGSRLVWVQETTR